MKKHLKSIIIASISFCSIIHPNEDLKVIKDNIGSIEYYERLIKTTQKEVDVLVKRRDEIGLTNAMEDRKNADWLAEHGSFDWKDYVLFVAIKRKATQKYYEIKEENAYKNYGLISNELHEKREEKKKYKETLSFWKERVVTKIMALKNEDSFLEISTHLPSSVIDVLKLQFLKKQESLVNLIEKLTNQLEAERTHNVSLTSENDKLTKQINDLNLELKNAKHMFSLLKL